MITSTEIKPEWLDYATVDGMKLLWNVPTVDPRPLVPGQPVKLVCVAQTGQCITLDFEESLFRSWPCVKIGPWILPGELECWCQYRLEPPAIRGDVNKDGYLNIGDVIMVTNCQGNPPTPECWACDLDRDADVDAADVQAVKESQR